MKEGLHFLARCALLMGLLACGVRAEPGKNQNEVKILDETGQVLHRSRYIWLAPGRAGFHVALVQYLDLSSGYDAADRRVYVSGEGCESIGFRPNSYRLYHPVAGNFPGRSGYPVAKRKAGKIYIPADVMRSFFSDVCTLTWESHARTLTLQKKHTKKLAS
jgi:hypothetical protein